MQTTPFRSRIYAILTLTVLGLLLFRFPALADPKSFEAKIQESETREKAELLAAINQDRAAHRLKPLAEDPLLNQTAEAHSQEMFDRDYFSHRSPTPLMTTPLDRYLQSIRASGAHVPDTLRVGENLYYCSLCTGAYNVNYAHRALMNSREHRANLLDPGYARVGLGLFHDRKGGFWLTEMFVTASPPPGPQASGLPTGT